MERNIQTVLKRWESSLINFGKVDQWNINDDMNVFGNFIISGKPASLRKAIRECRDYSMSCEYKADVLLSKVQSANTLINKKECHNTLDNVLQAKPQGQAKRFSSITKKLYNEKLRFMNGENLRNIDISMEDGCTTRKVRRIVEKKMSQAYYQQNKRLDNEGCHDKHYLKRATSFQLHNLGYVDYTYGTCRTSGTHWKPDYDPILGRVVYKKKLGYSSYDEAYEASREYMFRHPHEYRPISAYKCDYCNKWHIGHYTPDEKKHHSSVTFLGKVS